MKKINNFKQLVVGESYLIFVGYDRSPSGYDIGTFNLGGNFEMHINRDVIPYTEQLGVYTLPIVKQKQNNGQQDTGTHKG